MKVLVCGAHGSVGRAVCARLERCGCQVLKGVRRATREDEVSIDYTKDPTPADWLPKLHGVDVVINTVGILAERGAATFDAVHRRAPIALFDAACMAGATRIVQVSALGAETGDTRYFTSKRAADDYLQTLPIDHVILRPSLIYSENGTSTHFFRLLASLPVHLLPAGGHQPLRPVHVDELAKIIAHVAVCSGANARAGDSAGSTNLVNSADSVNPVNSIDSGDPGVTNSNNSNSNSRNNNGSNGNNNNDSNDNNIIDIAGATQLEYRDMLAIFRQSMGLPPALRVNVPRVLLDAFAVLLDRVPGSMLTRNTWRMLQTSAPVGVAATAAALGRMPAGVETFMTRAEAARIRAEALAQWRRALLRYALAIVWLWTALVSAFVYPAGESLALLARVHLHGAFALGALWGAAALDGALGVATLARPGRRLWLAQMLLISAYSVVIGIALPEFLWHPFGPILKNLPILALLFVMLGEETLP